LYDLRGLENYTCADEQGKDQGINIRHKVKEMIDFIQDDDKLREERKKAKKNKDKYVGMSNDSLGMGMGYRVGGGSWEEPSRRDREDFNDWDSNQGNGSSSHQRRNDDDSDLSVDEQDRRDKDFDRECSKDDRFGEFRDSEEPNKRPEREFRLAEKEKVKTPASSRPVKKVDLGAAAFYKGDAVSSPSHVSIIKCLLFIHG